MKVIIIGSVHDGKKFLQGEVELPDSEALRLINDGYAEVVAEKSKSSNNEPSHSETSSKKKK